MMCRTHSSTMHTHRVTVQGHRFYPWILCPLCISFTPGRILSKLWSNIHLSGTMCRIITQPCRLKVKVTVEAHKFEPWIWCRLHISFTPGRIFFKRWSNVCLSEMMCRTHNSAMLTQGHQFEPWILGPLHCHSDCLVKFGSNVRLSEWMCRTYNSTMQSQGQSHNWRSSVSPYLLNPLKDFRETLVKCLP